MNAEIEIGTTMRGNVVILIMEDGEYIKPGGTIIDLETARRVSDRLIQAIAEASRPITP